MSFDLYEQVQIMQAPSLLITTTFILVISLLAAKWWRDSTTGRKSRLPPSPPTLPVIGNLHQLGTYPHRTLQALAQRYGPIMLLHMGRVPTVIVSSARLAREVMKTHDIVLSDRPRLKAGYRLLYGGKDVALAPYGEYWRQMRSICVLQLLSNKQVQSFRFVREEEVTNLVERIGNSFPTPVDLSDAFSSMTSDIICRVALGRKYGESDADGRKLKRMLAELMTLLGGLDVGDFIPSLGWIHKLSGLDSKVDRVAKEIDDFMEGVVEEHMSKLKHSPEEAAGGDRNGSSAGVEGEKRDFVDVLLEVQRDKSTGFPLSRVSVKAIIMVSKKHHNFIFTKLQ